MSVDFAHRLITLPTQHHPYPVDKRVIRTGFESKAFSGTTFPPLLPALVLESVSLTHLESKPVSLPAPQGGGVSVPGTVSRPPEFCPLLTDCTRELE